jgi:hypothetical protein
MRSATVALVALTAALAAAPTASGASYDVVSSLGGELDRVAAATPFPVRVPAKLSLDFDGQVFPSGSTTSHGWVLGLDGASPCGANACFLAQISGEHGGRVSFRRKAKLARGITGRYKPLTCGGSCSPPMLEWKQGAMLYAIQAKIGASGGKAQRAAMVRAANSMIRSAPR